ncbi:Bud site selection protein 6 [Ceratobasidium sp. 414]|nr:Bud site selection protein 6 [Ceratobasidium sp. 414]
MPQPPPGDRQQSVNYPAPNEYDQGNPPQSRNSSRSSTRGPGREGSVRSGSAPVPAVQTAVTRLLVATKNLLESLTNWSKGEINEAGVSDSYVRMGNDFNAAVAAFQACGIDMTDLLDVPEQLRRVLETALAEEATPENLDVYLPEVRAIIKNLLQGLRVKQHDYKVSGSRRSDTPHSVHERSNSMAQSERSDRASVISRSSTQPSQRSSSFRPDSGMQIPAPPNSGGDHWVGGFAAPPQGPGPQPQPPGEYQPSGPAQPPNKTISRSSTSSSQQPYGRSPLNFIHQPVQEETDDDSSRKQAVLRRPSGHARSLSRTGASSGGGPVNDALARVPSMAPQLPPISADVKRYSLSDNPILRNSPPHTSSALPNASTEAAPQPPQPGRSPGGSSSTSLPPPPPNVVVESATSVPPNEPAPPPSQPTINRPMSPSPPPETPTSDGGQAELNDKALSALKSREALTRRASKRFSTYTYNKMTGSPNAPATTASGAQLKNRRSMIAGNLLSNGDLNTLSEVEDAPSPNKAQRSRTLDAGRRAGMGGEDAPPVPPLPNAGSRFLPSTAEETVEEVEGEEKAAESALEVTPTPKAPAQPARPPSPPANRPFTVFLQLESQVRKAEFEPGMTLAALRILFVEKFAYNPGLDNFPDIYIRDPTSQVMYELEDIREVKEKSLLSLNIEPLGQIKQHIDSQMSSLSQDIRELKSTVTSMKRLSVQPAVAPPPSAAPESARPSESKFQSLARRLSKIRTTDGVAPDSAQTQQPSPATTMLQPQLTGASLVSQSTGVSSYTTISDAASARIVSDLKTQFDDIVMLRRDLGVMRQMYVDFVNQTKSSISNMRTQAQAVRQLAGTKVSGDRAYVVAGREKLDSRTTTLLTKLEELQDSVENLRHDVVKRHVTPRPAAMKLLKETIDSTAAELQSIEGYISTVQPMWKQTWARELAEIVEEQEFLRHISEFVEDLAADHAEAVKIFEDINGVVSMRPSAPTARSVGRSFRPPPPPEEGHQGLSGVFSQIRDSNVDPDQRMRAIEASQRQRKLDLAGRSNAFTAELSGYVQGKKLKMTGGAEEAERVRQKRNEVTLKAMFGVNGNGGGGASVNPQPSPSRSAGSGSSPAAPTGLLPSASEGGGA